MCSLAGVFTSAVDLRRGEVLEIASCTAGDRFPGLEAGCCQWLAVECGA